MRYLITGGCGFLGSNLASEVIRRGGSLLVLDNLTRAGSEANLAWLGGLGGFEFVRGDTREAAVVDAAVERSKPDVVFHLAGQVAMTTSIADPRADFETNVVGGFNVLEAVRRKAPDAAVFYSSTNKVYGDLEHIPYEETATRYRAIGHERGFDETQPLHFQSPYGCSKGAMDQYMLDYAKIFGLRTCVFRHSSIFGDRQFATFDQGWIGWFMRMALEARRDPAGEGFTVSGTGKQVRDVLFASDIVACYFAALERIDTIAGEAFNIGGGMENSLSLLELFAFLESELGVTLRYRHLEWRTSDQKVFVADVRKARDRFGWEPTVSRESGLRSMLDWVARSG